MRIVAMLCCAFGGVGAADAQIYLNHPEQFYTNGERVRGWTRNEAAKLSSSILLVKHPKNSLSYRQQLLIAFDDDPKHIHYYDIFTEKFIGRYDLESNKYSLLPQQYRKKSIEDIKEFMFPPPDERPRISDLFEQTDEGQPNNDQLMMPPPTMMFPRLRDSTWEGFFTEVNQHRRTAMTLAFSGANGNYSFGGRNGQLNNVQYLRPQKDMLVIRGTWVFGRNGGGFEFQIMMMNLNEFQGEYWVGNNRQRRFLWDGKRTAQ